jgi:hypothetical protein
MMIFQAVVVTEAEDTAEGVEEVINRNRWK